MQYIQIDDSNRKIILELFNKSIDKEGFIIEKRTGKRLVCPYSKKNIQKNSFSILPGSATFVNNEIYCFAEHIVTHR
ncbi:MAG: hypothetical protein NTW30_03460 [Candidatus Aenigmarchaeota archaeon]|nr:hypothetical protein [Candidatus Aenigmarchaeota archaeon]